MHKHIHMERKTKECTHTQMICASQCDHMVWRGLPTHRRGSVRLQCTVQLSAITSCLPALNGHAKPARLSPVTALKLNQAERRHSSPYRAISISMRSGKRSTQPQTTKQHKDRVFSQFMCETVLLAAPRPFFSL